MAGKKNVDVLTLLQWGNKNLRREDEFATADFKVGICSMLEMVLHASGNYEGFTFIDSDDCNTGTLGYYSRIYWYSSKMRKESEKRDRLNKRGS